MLTLRTHDIVVFRGMNDKLASKNFFWKSISRTEGENDEMGIPKSCDRCLLRYSRQLDAIAHFIQSITIL